MHYNEQKVLHKPMKPTKPLSTICGSSATAVLLNPLHIPLKYKIIDVVTAGVEVVAGYSSELCRLGYWYNGEKGGGITAPKNHYPPANHDASHVKKCPISRS